MGTADDITSRGIQEIDFYDVVNETDDPAVVFERLKQIAVDRLKVMIADLEALRFDEIHVKADDGFWYRMNEMDVTKKVTKPVIKMDV
jgi:hypothetical protein